MRRMRVVRINCNKDRELKGEEIATVESQQSAKLYCLNSWKEPHKVALVISGLAIANSANPRMIAS